MFRQGKIFKLFLVVAVMFIGLFFAFDITMAQGEEGGSGNLITVDDLGLTQIENDIGLPNTDIRLIIARIIRIALGLLGIVALLLILYAGFTWMTAGGNEDQIQKAKKILVNAVIGLIIILSAYAIVSFVINSLVDATTGPGDGGSGGGDGGGSFTTSLYITSMPGNDFGCGARNLHPVIVFNRPVNLSTVTNNIIIRKKSDNSLAEGVWNYVSPTMQNRIVFDPIGDCDITPPQNDCLEADTTYELYFSNASGVKSQNEPSYSLNCNIGNFSRSCRNNPSVEFTTGSGVDTEPPTISISSPFEGQAFGQGAVIPFEINYSDNFGVQNVGLFFGSNEVDTVSISGCEKSGTVKLNWLTGQTPTGTHMLTGITTDFANHNALANRQINLLPGHCFDNELNFGEIEAGPPACGGGCGQCVGQQCSENSDCASGWCLDGLCVNRMRIDDFSPSAGAVSSTYVTISGQYFGNSGGKVHFRKAGAGSDIWTEAFVANCGAGINNWTQSQIVVKVPPDAITGPIKVETAPFTVMETDADGNQVPGSATWTDITDNDNWGVNKNFIVNNELLPGLCALQPNSGLPYSDTYLLGENFGNTQNSQSLDRVLFGTGSALIRSWADRTVLVRVPALGTGAISVKIANEGKESNALRYYVLESLSGDLPIIESISPTVGAKGEYITITGSNFGSLRGSVWFKLDGEGEARLGSFDFPQACEGSVWSDKQIIVKFPENNVFLGNNYSVQVQRANGTAGPIGATFRLQNQNPAPGICKIVPTEGPIPFTQGAIMNIYGEYFSPNLPPYTSGPLGDNYARPYFWRLNANPSSIDGRVTTGQGNIQLINNENIKLIPPNETETGPVVMYRPSGQQLGNSMSFAVYNCLENNNTCANTNYKCCQTGVDAGVCIPNNDLCAGETRSTNYIWRFNTGPFPPTARVVERCNSLTDLGQNLPSPSPDIRWTSGGNMDHYNVCRTALVNVEFSSKMLANTINANTLQIYRCVEGSVESTNFNQRNTCERDGGPLNLDPSSYQLFTASGGEFSIHEYLQAKLSSGQWADNTYYQVVLNSGIQSAPLTYEFNNQVRYLDAKPLEASRPCGGGSAYCFLFKTDERDCRLNNVVVTPSRYWTAILESPIKYRNIKTNSEDAGSTLYWRGTGLSDQRCIMMDMSEYNWDWAVVPVNPVYAQLYGNTTGTNGNMTEISAVANTVAVGLDNESARVRAFTWRGTRTATNLKFGDSLLTIDLSNPKVVDYWPNCLESCTNAEVGMKFNIIMSSYNLANAVRLYECVDENCNIQLPVSASVILDETDRRLVKIIPNENNGFLKLNTIYNVVVSKTGTTIADQMYQVWSGSDALNPTVFAKPMQQEFTWRFRTKSDLCILDNVNVTPLVFRSITVQDRKVFSAEARSSPDNCDPKGQRLNSRTIDWEWTSSDWAVATTTQFRTYGQNPFCTTNCLKRGSDILYGQPGIPLCGNGIVEAGEDCDPPFKNSQGFVECTLNCLRPGNNAEFCGNGVVESQYGEECDTADEATKFGCASNCVRAGSSLQTDAQDIGASICGNGTIGYDEDCDIGISADFSNPNSAYNCSNNCLHLGSKLSAQWCGIGLSANPPNYSGFPQDEFIIACNQAVSRCGDGITSPNEDVGCELGGGNISSACSNLCLANDISLKKCSPTSSIMIGNNEIIIWNEGCDVDGQLSGSSLLYSTPSVCGDRVVGIGEDLTCEQGFITVNSYINPWSMVIGRGLGTPDINTNIQSAKITAQGIHHWNPNRPSDVRFAEGSGDYIVSCGYQTNEQCQAINGPDFAVANNSCCYEKPAITGLYPDREAENVCRNSYIEAVFDRNIDPNTLAGNILIVRAYAGSGSCPDGSEDVTLMFQTLSSAQEESWLGKIFGRLANFIKRMIGINVSAFDFIPSRFCLANETGTPEVISDMSRGVYGESRVMIKLKEAMVSRTVYYVLLRDGIKDVLGVSVGRIDDWRFETGENICEINRVEVNPSEYLYREPNFSSGFQAIARTVNGQMVQAVPGYRWVLNWAPQENEYVSMTYSSGISNSISSKNRNGELDVVVSVNMIENDFGGAGQDISGSTHLTLYFCDNPWSNNNFIDSDYDFKTFYCRDSGVVGHGDDLPDFELTGYFENDNQDYLRRYVFTNSNNKDAIGVQIFANPQHLSVSDWYAEKGFRGNMRSLNIDGYDAITDGNNYYIDAIKTQPIVYQSSNYYTNIYQFSINGDATGDSKKVFEQLISNLSFNLSLSVGNTNNCANNQYGSQVNYSMSCSSDMDCLNHVEAIKKLDPATTTVNQYYCLNKKEKLQRDYSRLKDMREMIAKINFGNGAVAAWPMDLISYNKTPDISGNGFEAHIADASGLSFESGFSGQAIKIDGSGRLEVEQLIRSYLVGKSLTVAGRIKTNYNGEDNIMKIADANSRGLFIYLAGGKIYAQYNSVAGNVSITPANCSNNIVISDGSWHSFSVTIKQSDPQRVSLYVDGRLYCSRGGSFGSITPNAVVAIGKINSDVQNSFSGLLDDIRIYSHEFSLEEITAYANNTLPINSGYPKITDNTFLPGQAISSWVNAWGQLSSESGFSMPVDPINKLGKSGSCIHQTNNSYKSCYFDSDCANIPLNNRKSYWAGDGDTRDSGSLVNHANIEGTVGFADGIGHDSAFEFAGEAGSMLVANRSDSYIDKFNYMGQMIDNKAYSVSVWIYPTKKNTAVIMQQGGSDENGESLGGFMLGYSGMQWNGSEERFNNGTIRFAIFPTSSHPNTKYYFIDSNTPLALNQWHHITAIYNWNFQGISKMTLMLNGNVVDSSIYSANKNGSYTVLAPNVSVNSEYSQQPFKIGSAFNGKIDNIAYYSKSLTINEVQNIYNGVCIAHDLLTGWSAENRRFSFVCNTSSMAYRYIYNNENQSFSLRTNFEYLTKDYTPLNWANTFFNDFTGGYASYNNGICLSSDEVSSPYTNTCGDGVVGAGEQCDPPGKVDYNTSGCPAPAQVVEKRICNNSCQWSLENTYCREAVGGRCGDGIIQSLAGEVCDDGPLNGTNGRCDNSCTGIVNFCGNGQLDPGEFCDTSNQIGKCIYRDGVVYELDPNAKEPIFYFLVDLTGTMSSAFPGAPSPGTRLAMVKYSLPLIAQNFNNPGSKAKMGIASYNCPIRSYHNKDWMTGTIGYFSANQVRNTISPMVTQTGQNTDSLFDWIRDTIYPILNSGEDMGKPINLVYITDGGKAGSCSPYGTLCPTQKIATLNQNYNITTHIIGVGNIMECDMEEMAAAGKGQFFQITAGADALVKAMTEIYKTPCEQYSQYSGYSCNSECTGFGGYCGDGKVDPYREQCEIGGVESCTISGMSGQRQCLSDCTYGSCVPTSQLLPVFQQGTCGNGIVEEFEACDMGSNNGIKCTPTSPLNQCSYCSYDCRNVITVDRI